MHAQDKESRYMFYLFFFRLSLVALILNIVKYVFRVGLVTTLNMGFTTENVWTR